MKENDVQFQVEDFELLKILPARSQRNDTCKHKLNIYHMSNDSKLVLV